MRYDYIAIEGLIGVGKTTLSRRLSERMGARLVLEEFEDNPFLPRFYAEKERYAFSVELSFLAQRYHQFKRVAEQELFDSATIADHYISKSLIFAQANLPPDEFKLFSDLYNIMLANMPKPQLLVYLHLEPDQLLERIAERGREYEQAIDREYLLGLQRSYFDHLPQLLDTKVLVLNMAEVDVRMDDDLDLVMQAIDREYKEGMSIAELKST